MKWFRMFWDTKRKPRFISDKEDLKGYEDWDLTKGNRIELWNHEAWLKTTDPECDGPPEDVLQNHLGLPVFSERMIGILDEYNITGVQYLPIKVFRCNGELIKGYSVANILNVIPALDHGKSGYSVFPNDHINVKQRGKISGIHKLVINRNNIGSVDIFRLEEFPLQVILSEKFVKTFKKNKLTGWVFKEITLSD